MGRLRRPGRTWSRPPTAPTSPTAAGLRHSPTSPAARARTPSPWATARTPSPATARSGSRTLDPAPPATRTVQLAPALGGRRSSRGALDVREPGDADRGRRCTARTPAGPGADQIAAGLGEVILSGNGGNDTIGTANDNVLADSAGHQGGHDRRLRRARGALPRPRVRARRRRRQRRDEERVGRRPGLHRLLRGDRRVRLRRRRRWPPTSTSSTPAPARTRVYGSNGQDFVTTASVAHADHQGLRRRAARTSSRAASAPTSSTADPDDDYVVASPATVGEPGSATDVLGSARVRRRPAGSREQPEAAGRRHGQRPDLRRRRPVADLRRHHGRRLRGADRSGQRASRVRPRSRSTPTT